MFTLVFTLMFSTTSFAEWTKWLRDSRGNIFYVDFERTRKVDGYVYYWTLVDYVTRREQGHSSALDYWRGDCKLFRSKNLSQRTYEGQMGRGDVLETFDEEDVNWTYPVPNSASEVILVDVCAR